MKFYPLVVKTSKQTGFKYLEAEKVKQVVDELIDEVKLLQKVVEILQTMVEANSKDLQAKNIKNNGGGNGGPVTEYFSGAGGDGNKYRFAKDFFADANKKVPSGLRQAILNIVTYHSDEGTSGYLLSDAQIDKIVALVEKERV